MLARSGMFSSVAGMLVLCVSVAAAGHAGSDLHEQRRGWKAGYDLGWSEAKGFATGTCIMTTVFSPIVGSLLPAFALKDPPKVPRDRILNLVGRHPDYVAGYARGFQRGVRTRSWIYVGLGSIPWIAGGIYALVHNLKKGHGTEDEARTGCHISGNVSTALRYRVVWRVAAADF